MSHFSQNLGIKLLSLLLSFCLFWYVHRQQESEISFYVPLTLLHDAKTRVRDEATLGRTVRITLSGPAERLKAVEDQVKAVVNLKGQGSGSYRATVEVNAPEDTDSQVAIDWQPRVVNVRLEGRTSRQFPAHHTFNVQPPEGLALSDVQIEPETATVWGWESAVRRVKQLQAVINSLGTGTTIDLVVALRPVDSQGAEVSEDIQVQPPTIKVMAQLRRSEWSKPVYVSPTFGSIPSTVRLRQISLTPNRLTIRGSEAAVGPVHFLETEPIPLPDSPGVVDREVRVEVPEGLKTVEPPRVRVVIALQGAIP